MKILQINSVCGLGSTGRIVTDLYDTLSAEGMECCIAYGRGTSPEGYNTIKIGDSLDNNIHFLESLLLDRHGLGSRKATKNFIDRIIEYQPDIIHLHNIHGYYINIKILFEFLSTLEIPIVWLLHDQWAFSPHAAYFDVKDDDELPKANSKSDQRKEYPRSYANRSYKNYLLKKELFTSVKDMTIVTPSKWLADLTQRSFLNKYPIKVIHNGIDLNLFKPTINNFKYDMKIYEKRMILGVASEWDERKGLKDFNELAEKLDSQYQIVLVGIDKKKDSVCDRIISINRTNNIKELIDIYSSADVFINPTMQDNFPTTNIEALACGTPVITYNTGGSPEAIDELCGIVTERGNLAEMTKAISRIFDGTYNRKSCVSRSKIFDKEKVYSKYLILYNSLISK